MDAIHSMSSVAVSLVGIILSYYLALFGYRIWFHPLKAYPGPILAKISDFYVGFYSLSARLHLAAFSDHGRYGPVVRYGPNRLIFNSATALQDIYNNERVTKSHVYLNTVMSSGIPSIFQAIDKHTHRTKRKLIGQVVSERSMRMFEPTMMEQIDIFLGLLLASTSQGTSKAQPINMTDRSKRLGWDIVGLLSFGFHLNMQTDPTYRYMIRGVTIGNWLQNNHMQFPLLKRLRFERVLYALGKRQNLQSRAAVAHMIGNRLTQDKHAMTDFYSFVIDSLDKEGFENVTTSELWAEALFFTAAGGDTVTTALCALFFYLSRNPEVYRKLTEEVRAAFKSSAEIRGGPQLSSCRYLRACIDEALRISPPVGGSPWRELYAEERGKEPLVVDGHVIPPGTQVGVSFYALHHNPDYFPEPFNFRPERWLIDDSAALKRMNSAFTPFSIGPRNCAGKAMAYLELSLVLAKTLWYFDFEKAPGKQGEIGAGVTGRRNGRGRTEEFQLYDIFSSTHDGPYLVFHPRGVYCKELELQVPKDM